MTHDTTTTTRPQTAFDRALADFLSARDALDALPVDTTSGEVEMRAADAMGAAERRLFNTTPQTIADVRALAEICWCDSDSLPTADMIGKVLSGLRQIDGQPSRVFNPAKWVADYRRFGGGWVVTDDRVTLMQPVPCDDTLTNLMWELHTRGGEQQVKAIIAAGEAVQAPGIAVNEWEALCRRYEEAKTAIDAHREPEGTVFGSPEQQAHEAETERLADAQSDAFDAVMLTPAPHAPALAYKLAINSSFGGGEAWHKGAEIAEQLAADAARLLTEA